MRFKVDENLPLSIVELLRSAGHDASSVAGQGMKGIPDLQLLMTCVQEQRALVTLDLGFADIYSFDPDVSPGIVVLRPRQQGKIHVMKILQRALKSLTPDRLQHHLVIVEETQVRIHGERIGEEAE